MCYETPQYSHAADDQLPKKTNNIRAESSRSILLLPPNVMQHKTSSEDIITYAKTKPTHTFWLSFQLS